MGEIKAVLDRIVPNPWQTRQAHDGDDAHVQALAEDIAARGLLQVPLGRLVDDAGQPLAKPPVLDHQQWTLVRDGGALVQLAFGHNRLAAFRLLAEWAPDNGWQEMPVRIAALDDQAMALAAWSENAARKDLSAWERYLALRRLADDFGWNQEEIGDQVGLARATVANILRLGRLPEELQKKLHNGDLSERQALALLPIYELPEAALAQLEHERSTNDWTIRHLDEVIAHPDKKSSGDVREAIRDAVRKVTYPLVTAEKDYGRAEFPVDERIDGVAAPACLECANRLQETRCADLACYNQKQAIFERAQMAFASAATGLPGITRAELRALNWQTQQHFSGGNADALKRALEKRCPNLRLCYESGDPRDWDRRVPDYPHVGYVCVRTGDATTCECADNGRTERMERERAEEARRQKANEKLREATVKELTAGLRAQDVGAWRAVLYSLRAYSHYVGGSAEKVATMDPNMILENVARAVVGAAFYWQNSSNAAKDLAAWRKKCGWGVVVPEQTEEATPEASDA